MVCTRFRLPCVHGIEALLTSMESLQCWLAAERRGLGGKRRDKTILTNMAPSNEDSRTKARGKGAQIGNEEL